MAMNRDPKRVQQTRKNARKLGAFGPQKYKGGVGTDITPTAQPNQSQANQTCPLGQELITGPDGKKRCGTKRPRMPKAPNRGY